MRRLFVKQFPKTFCLRTVNYRNGRATFTFIVHAELNPDAHAGAESGCNAKRQPSFKSEALVISAVKALGSTFTMATTPSSTRESRPQSQTKGLDSGTPAQHPALSYTCQPFLNGLISMMVM